MCAWALYKPHLSKNYNFHKYSIIKAKLFIRRIRWDLFKEYNILQLKTSIITLQGRLYHEYNFMDEEKYCYFKIVTFEHISLLIAFI